MPRNPFERRKAYRRALGKHLRAMACSPQRGVALPSVPDMPGDASPETKAMLLSAHLRALRTGAKRDWHLGGSAGKSEPVHPLPLVASSPDCIGAHSLSVIQGGTFDVPLFERKADAKRKVAPADAFHVFVRGVALRAVSQAIRYIEGGRLVDAKEQRDTDATISGERKRGKGVGVVSVVADAPLEWSGGATQAGGVHQVNAASRADALGAAMEALWQWFSGHKPNERATVDTNDTLRLFRHGAEVFLPQETRSEVFRLAIRAATSAIRKMNSGVLSGCKANPGKAPLLCIGTPEEWGRLSIMDEREQVEGIDRATARKARKALWLRLGCAWPLPSGNAEYNARTAGRALRKRWLFLSLMARGESASVACKRAGLPQTFLIDGKLSKLAQPFGLSASELRGDGMTIRPREVNDDARGWFALASGPLYAKGGEFHRLAHCLAIGTRGVSGPFTCEPEAQRAAWALRDDLEALAI